MKRYDLSRIMTRAHYIFGHTFNTTFSYCLTKAWTDPITVHAWDAMTGDATTAMMPKQQSSARSMQDDGCI